MGASPRRIGRIIFIICLALVAAVGLYALFEAYGIKCDADRILYADPLAMEANLSVAGAYRGRFSGHEKNCLAFVVLLEVSPPFESYNEAEEALEGFVGHWEIFSEDGTVLAQQDAWLLPRVIFLRGDEKPAYPVCYLKEVPAGNCTFILTVETPGANLEGRAHRLSGRYEICGLEYLAATCTGVVGVAAALAGGVPLLVIFVKSRRRRRLAAD